MFPKPQRKLLLKKFTRKGKSGGNAWIERAWVDHRNVVVKFDHVNLDFGNDSCDWQEYNPDIFSDRYFYDGRMISQEHKDFSHTWWEGMKPLKWDILHVYS
jgi:hypothetical protein